MYSGIKAWTHGLLSAIPLAAALVLGIKFIRIDAGGYGDWLIIAHALVAVVAIGVGGLQFLQGVRETWPFVHRWVGRIYLGSSLFAGASALLISTRLPGPNLSSYGLILTAGIWMCCTGLGFCAIRQRKFLVHRRWMIRSYSLALTALTLRLYSRSLSHLGVHSSELISVIGIWGALLSNLAVAEVLARKMSPGRYSAHSPSSPLTILRARVGHRQPNESSKKTLASMKKTPGF
jgi:predicted membrane protein DUF2306